MLRLLFVVLLLLVVASNVVRSQDTHPTDDWMEQLRELSEYTDDEFDEKRLEALYTDLSHLAEHPIDLNTATTYDLHQLPFLSDAQVDSILSYRQRHHYFLTVYELRTIDVLDWITLRRVAPFVCVNRHGPERPAITLANLLHHGASEWVMKYGQTVERKRGYTPAPDSTSRRYLGEPFGHAIRYVYTFDDRLQAGFAAEKDAGEPFANATHKGYDYYSAHLVLKDFGRLRTLAMGDFKATFGQGLVVSHDYTPARGTLAAEPEYRNNGFRRHYSTNEQQFFRGIAATLALSHWQLSLFGSSRKVDATTDGTTITSLKVDGLHRTRNERRTRHTVSLRAIGGNLRYARSRMHIGLTALAYDFDGQRVDPPPTLYNHYDFRGRSNANLGLDYMIKNDRLKLFGETALSTASGATATLAALQWTPSSEIIATLLYRNYSPRYHALFASAFARTARVRNEEGLYLGLTFTPAPRWLLTGHADLFRFPWMKPRVSFPSTGSEYALRIDWTDPREIIAAYVRFRSQRTEGDAVRGHEIALRPIVRHRLRAQITCTIDTVWALRTALDFSLHQPDGAPTARGHMLSEAISWRPQRLPIRAELFAALFLTDGFAARLYSYEKNLLYTFATPSLYGRGLRLSGLLYWRPAGRRLTLSAKIGWTHLFTGDSIGSGLETIRGRNRTDLYAMLRWTF